MLLIFRIILFVISFCIMSQETIFNLKKEFDDDVPPQKRIKVVSAWNKSEKLEEKLSHILSCSVCLELPVSACMQCCHGHLMCIGCYHHLLADARLKDEQATCPTCRVDVSRGSCTRNLAVEKTISELPVQCTSCSETFTRNNIGFHRSSECSERIVFCKFHLLGCGWSGRAHQVESHADKCEHSHKTPRQLLDCLETISQKQVTQVSRFEHIVSLLSCEHISYMEVQLRPHRTDDFVTKLFYESNRFHLMGQTWVLKAFISAVDEHPSNPTLSSDRRITYQLILKSKIQEPLEVDCMLLRAPYDDVNVVASPFYTKFTPDVYESRVCPLVVNDSNRLLGMKVINLRLFMFHHK